MRKWLFRIGIALLALVIAFRLADWAARRRASIAPPPQPNSYGEILSLARSVKKLPVDLAGLSREQTQALANENRPTVERTRKALQMQSGVLLDTKRGWQEQHEVELKDLKRLAVVLAIEARAQILEGQTNHAARCHVDTVRLGQAVSRGGILIDGITGLTIETIGSSSLEALIPYVDAQFCHEAARTLEELDAQRGAPEKIIEQEKSWSARRYGLIDLLGGTLAREALNKRRVEFVTKSHAARARTQRVMLRLAARAYEIENGKPPTSHAQLVPGYLARIPRDPETGKDILELPAAIK